MVIYLLFINLLSIFNLIFINKNKVKILKITSISWLIFLWVTFIIILKTINYENTINFSFNVYLGKIYLINFDQIFFSCDNLSLLMIGLSILLTILCLLVSWETESLMKKEFIILHHIILIILLLVFIVQDLIMFYLFFEATLIPLFLMIGIWGYREEKIKAAYYFFFYTMIGSLFMLIAIFKLYSLYASTNLVKLSSINIDRNTQIWLFFGLIIALAVKIPMFPAHIWLPQAHVEAPINGSVLLAGILLKLGGYGFIKFLIPLCKNSSWQFSPVIIIFSLLAIIIPALSTCRQNDIKKLIAYSSVSHMGLVTIAIFTLSNEGIIASIILMLAHGFVSSSLFIIAYILYKRFKTRTIKYFKGLITSLPLFSSMFIILILANIGFPGSINFISEFMALLSLSHINYKIILISCLGPFLASVYSLMLYNKISFGFSSKYIYNPRDLNLKEFIIIILLSFIIIALGLKPELLINSLIINSLYFLI